MDTGQPVTITAESITHHGVAATKVSYDKGVKYVPTAIYVDGCDYCDREKEAGSTFFPSHFASARCRSGSYNHCTCDTCF